MSELLKGTIISDDKGRRDLLSLLPEEMCIRKHLFFHKRDESVSDYSQQHQPMEFAPQDDSFVKEFHKKCDNHMTLTVIKISEDCIIGGYTEARWISAGNIMRMSDRNNSFLFHTNPDGRCKFDLKKKNFERFHKFVVNKGQNEIYHGSDYAANFIEVKLKGPNQNSEFRPKGKCYHLPVEFIKKQSNYPQIVRPSHGSHHRQHSLRLKNQQTSQNFRNDV